jgi:hypothetical protein
MQRPGTGRESDGTLMIADLSKSHQRRPEPLVSRGYPETESDRRPKTSLLCPAVSRYDLANSEILQLASSPWIAKRQSQQRF